MLWPSILTGGAVISGLVFIWSTYAGTQTQRYIFKPLTTILILGIALTLPDPISSFYRLMVAIGMLFSLGGDIFLMLPGNTFVFGLVSFLVAHLFYIVAYQSRAGFALYALALCALRSVFRRDALSALAARRCAAAAGDHLCPGAGGDGLAGG